MSVLPKVSLLTVKQEIESCQLDCQENGWIIYPIDESSQTFVVSMTSPVDNHAYWIEFKFDNYKEIPYLIEFISPDTGERGTRKLYPSHKEGFFHSQPAICHPCSRKAYAGYTGLHSEWNLVGWQTISSTLINLRNILLAIYARISDKNNYNGPMEK